MDAPNITNSTNIMGASVSRKIARGVLDRGGHEVTILVLVAAGATAVVLIRRPVHQVLLLSIYGVLLAVLFLAFLAPRSLLSGWELPVKCAGHRGAVLIVNVWTSWPTPRSW